MASDDASKTPSPPPSTTSILDVTAPTILPRAAAATSVLGVTEIFENIIRFLPHQAFLVLQRTNKEWLRVIVAWSQYDDAMCFKAATTFDKVDKKATGCVGGHALQPPRPSQATSAQEFLDLLQPNEYTLNPLFTTFFTKSQPGESYQYKLESPIILSSTSINDMFATQPPVIVIELTFERHRHNCPCPVTDRRYIGCTQTMQLKRKSGVTLGDLVAVISCLVSDHWCSFRSWGDLDLNSKRDSERCHLSARAPSHPFMSGEPFRFSLQCRGLDVVEK